MSKILRRAVTVLLVSTVASLACAAPSHAGWWIQPDRTVEAPAPRDPGHGFVVSLLLRLLGYAGGAMDPNGGK